MVAGLALLGVSSSVTAAASDPADGPARGRLELRGGLGLRDDRLAAEGERVTATGSAVSELVAAGAWFAADRPFGLAARLEMERFSVQGPQDMPPAVALFGLDLAAGGTGRLTRGRLTLEGMLGYSFLQVPLVRAPDAMPLEAAPLSVHGPAVGATLAFAATDWLGLEAGGRAVPFTFGGQRDGHGLPLRRFALNAGASVGRFDGAGLRWSALVLYELGSTSAQTATVDLTQTRQQVSLGLRAAFRSAPPPLPAVAQPAPPPARGRIVGVVRAAPPIAGEPAGPPLGEVTVSVAGQVRASTDAAGAFAVDALPPGLVRLRLARPGLAAREEVVSVPAAGEVRLDLTLEPAGGPVPAALIGLVRDDNGTPVTARVEIVERGLTAVADERGQFRFELPPGRYTVLIAAPGFVTQRKVLRAAPGEQNIYNLDLQRER